MTSNLRSPTSEYTFRLIGKAGKYFSLRAPTWKTKNRNSLDAQQFEGEIVGWLVDNTIGEWHVSSFKNTPGYIDMPHAFNTGNCLCVLIESATDLVQFEKEFNVVVDTNEIL